MGTIYWLMLHTKWPIRMLLKSDPISDDKTENKTEQTFGMVGRGTWYFQVGGHTRFVLDT